MKSKRIPLVGSLIDRNSNPGSFLAKDQRFDNCYPEVIANSITGKTAVFLNKRIGTTVTAAAGGSYVGTPGAGIWNSNVLGTVGVFPFLDGSNLKLYASDGTSIATKTGIIGAGAFINDTSISGVSNITIVAVKSADSKLHGYFFPEGGAITEITDADYPTNQSPSLTTVGDFAHMDGYAFIMDSTGSVWNSDLNSLANWTATSVIPANAYADGGSGVVRYGDYIAAFGLNSIEFYRNAGNPSGSPLARVAGATRRVRCIQAATPGYRTYLNVGDDVFFIGGPADSGAFGVYKLDGLGAPAKVSSPAVDKIINATMSATLAGSFVMHGMTHLVVTVSSTYSLCLCLQTGIWWYLIAGGTYNFGCALGVSGVAYFTNMVTAGKGIYVANPASPTFQDDAVAYTATVQTLPIDFGTNRRKFFKGLHLIGDVQSTSGNTAVSWSDDDYANFSTAINLDMSVASPFYRASMGTSRRRAFKIADAVNRPLRLEAMELEFEEGAN